MLAEVDAISCRDSSPSLYTVNSNIDPPYARNAEDAPQIGFAKEASGWGPLNDEIPNSPGEDDERYSQAKEELSRRESSVCRRVCKESARSSTHKMIGSQDDIARRRSDGEEGRDARAWEYCQLVQLVAV